MRKLRKCAISALHQHTSRRYTVGEGTGELWRIDFATATPVAEAVTNTDSYRTLGLSFSADGQRLVMAQDPSNTITATFVEIFNLASGTATVIVPDDGYADRFPQYSPAREEITWARGTDTTIEALSDIWITAADGTGQLNLTSNAELDHAYPHFSLSGDHVFFLEGSVLWVIDREGIDQPQVLFDLGEISNFDIATSYPPVVCGEVLDDFDYQGFGPEHCSGTVTVTNDLELAAYHADLGYDPGTGTVKNLTVAYNPSGLIEIHSPCQVDLVGENGTFDIDAEHLRVFGKKGVWVAQGYASQSPSITTAGDITLVSEQEHARIFQGMNLTANRICVQGYKKAEIAKDCVIETEGAVELVGTGTIGSSDALIDQGNNITAGSLRLQAYTEAQIAKDVVIEAGEVLLYATGDIGATQAIIKQGARIWAGVMSMLSNNKVTIERNVEITVDGNLEIEAAGRCRIDNRATITAGSYSGSCYE